MLTRALRQCLFALVHLFVYVLLAVQNIYDKIFIRFRLHRDTVTEKNDIRLILKSVPRFKRKLRHLVMMADADHHTISELACVVIWSLLAGIPYVSFYDRYGTLKKREEELFHEVEKYKKGIPGYIKWSHRPDLNGYTNGMHANTINVNVFMHIDGQTKVAQCIREIAEGTLICRRDSKEFTSQEFNECISHMYPSIPDPELILYTGPLCCPQGILPWHIRLTEFVRLSLDHSINVENYVGALYRYNQCDQRYGK